MKHIVTILGARPQFVKAAVVSKALKDRGIKEEILHTGQHYDHAMSDVFFEQLNIDPPVKNFNIGSGKHGEQTGKMLAEIEKWLLDQPQLPDALMVYGDTNSTIAGALAASKLHVPVIHVEAGLRSFNRKMPEEVNRVLTDHISDLLFCSSEIGVNQLEKEGVNKGVHNVGDVMYDAVLTFSEIAKEKVNPANLPVNIDEPFYLMTVHRPSNTDDPQNMAAILEAVGSIDKTVLWPVHPRNKKRLQEMKLPQNLLITDPVSYFEMLLLLKSCTKVITDSGGLQKEAYWMEKPCITVREETEWVETLEGGWNQLTGPNAEKIIHALKNEPTTDWKPVYGDGKASEKIAEVIGSQS